MTLLPNMSSRYMPSYLMYEDHLVTLVELLKGDRSTNVETLSLVPLPSSAARPRSTALGGFQERQREWYQSEITKYSEHHNVFNHNIS